MNHSIALIAFMATTSLALAEQTTVTFQEGADGYRGARDTYLVEDNPNADNGQLDHVTVDCCHDPTGAANDGLLRFDGIFGNGPDQIPIGSTIISAALTLTVTPNCGAPSTELHRMLQPWYDDDTWNFWVDGIDPDGSEAAVQVDAEVGPACGTLGIDVTKGLAAWSAGDTNYGWVLLKYGSHDGWVFWSSEAANVSNRPKLEVTFVPVCPWDLNGDGAVDHLDLLEVVHNFGACNSGSGQLSGGLQP